jgi:hypothetical protein
MRDGRDVEEAGLGQLDRGRRVAAEVLIQTGSPKRTYVLRGEGTTRLRPDLVATAVHAPPQTLSTRPIEFQAVVSEVNGDTGADATVTLSWCDSVLGTRTVTVPAGGQTPVTFGGVALTDACRSSFRSTSWMPPRRTDATNNTRTTLVDVTVLELASSRPLLPRPRRLRSPAEPARLRRDHRCAAGKPSRPRDEGEGPRAAARPRLLQREPGGRPGQDAVVPGHGAARAGSRSDDQHLVPDPPGRRSCSPTST